MSGLAAGQILGIPLGTLLAERFGFRAPFIAFAVTMAFTTLMVWRVIPQLDTAPGGARLSWRGALRGYVELLRQPSVAAASAAFAFIFLSISLFVVYLPAWRLGFFLNKTRLTRIKERVTERRLSDANSAAEVLERE